MHITGTVNNQPITDAIKLFSDHYADQEFLDSVSSSTYNYTRDKGAAIAKLIQGDKSTITFGTYHASGRSIASTDIPKKTIRFNDKKFVDPTDPQERQELVRDRVETVMHEYIHTHGYKHFTNWNFGYNRGTAPYKIGKIFRDYLVKQNLA